MTEPQANPRPMSNAEGLQDLRRRMLLAIDVIDANETGRCVWWEMVARALTDVAVRIDAFCPSAKDRGFVFTMLNDALSTIRKHAHDADVRARAACMESRYYTQDYHLSVEFWAQRLHDELAVKFMLPARCPEFPFRKQVAELRRRCAEGLAAKKSTDDPSCERPSEPDGTEG